MNLEREQKGAFYTPLIWVKLSQQYIADYLGENWQEEYYVWDCAAGTGNLLAGLVNKERIWASTLDKQDVDIMHDRIANGANLWNEHVFQFDFLNDDFSKLPKNLQAIINNPAERKKLIIYINPPYAEVATVIGRGKKGVNQSQIHDKYFEKLGTAARELYTQFLIRIYEELQGCIIAEFSTLKILQGAAFTRFRQFFQAKLEHCFIVPANSFDNVEGAFPIGFKLWNTAIKQPFTRIEADVYTATGTFLQKKTLFAVEKAEFINQWINQYKCENPQEYIGFLAGTNSNDFQHNNIVYILNHKNQMPNPRGIWISARNLFKVAIYFAVRHTIKANWLNDRDQFLFPNELWQQDTEFHNDCLAFMLFHGQNKISADKGTNYWIPFTEREVNANAKFVSNFMHQFISGKVVVQGNGTLLDTERNRTTPLVFSPQAQAVFEAGREVWKYYHQVIQTIPAWTGIQPTLDASLYDIKAYFQGRNAQGKMNNRSQDETFNQLLTNLRLALKQLAQKIEPKIYEYGFLRR